MICAHSPWRLSIKTCPPKYNLASLPRPLRYNTASGSVRALMRVIGAPLPLEIDGGIAGVIVLGWTRRLVRTVLEGKALETGPRLDQRAIGAEMLVAGPPLFPTQLEHFIEEQLRTFGAQHPLLVLAEAAVVPTALVQFPIQKPQPQEVVRQLLAEQSLRTHRVQRHQQPRLQQLLGRNRRPSVDRIEGIELRTESAQDLLGLTLDHAQRVIFGDSRFGIDQGAELRLLFRFSAHEPIHHNPYTIGKPKSPFSTAC